MGTPHIFPGKKKLDLMLTRATEGVVGMCDFCLRTNYDFNNTRRILVITGGDTQVSVCNEHEGELLLVLLKNYVRHRRRGKDHVGYAKPLLKPDEFEVDIINLLDKGDGE